MTREKKTQRFYRWSPCLEPHVWAPIDPSSRSIYFAVAREGTSCKAKGGKRKGTMHNDNGKFSLKCQGPLLCQVDKKDQIKKPEELLVLQGNQGESLEDYFYSGVTEITDAAYETFASILAYFRCHYGEEKSFFCIFYSPIQLLDLWSYNFHKLGPQKYWHPEIKDVAYEIFASSHISEIGDAASEIFASWHISGALDGEENIFSWISYSPIHPLDLWTYISHAQGPQNHWHPEIKDAACEIFASWHISEIGDAACEIFASWHISEIKHAACEIFASWHISEIGDAASEIFASWHISGALMEKRTFSPGSLIPQFTRWTFAHTFPTHRALRIIGILRSRSCLRDLCILAYFRCPDGEENIFSWISYSPIHPLDLWTYISHAQGPPNHWHPEIKDAACEIFASWHISEIVDAASEIFASWHISGALMEKRTFSPGSLIPQFTRWTFGHTFPTHRALRIIGILWSKHGSCRCGLCCLSEIKDAACEIFASWHISEIGDAASEIFASWHISGALMEKRTFSPGSLIPQFTRWTFGHTFPTHRALRIIGILWSKHCSCRCGLCCLSEIKEAACEIFASWHISEIVDAASEIFASWHISGALMEKRTFSPGSLIPQFTRWTFGHTFPTHRALRIIGILGPQNHWHPEIGDAASEIFASWHISGALMEKRTFSPGSLIPQFTRWTFGHTFPTHRALRIIGILSFRDQGCCLRDLCILAYFRDRECCLRDLCILAYFRCPDGEENIFSWIFYSPIHPFDLWTYISHAQGPLNHWHPEIKHATCEIFASWHISEIGDAASEIFASWHISGALMEKRTFSPGSLIPQFTRWTFGHTFPTHRALRIIGILWSKHCSCRCGLCCLSDIKHAACEIFASWHISEIGDAASEIFASWHISGALMEKRTFSPGSLIPQFTRWTFAHTFPTHRALRIIGILWSKHCSCRCGLCCLSEIKEAACKIFASWHISGDLMDKRTVSPGSFTAQLTCWTPGHTFPMPGPAKSLASCLSEIKDAACEIFASWHISGALMEKRTFSPGSLIPQFTRWTFGHTFPTHRALRIMDIL
ncbi:hypothetical protein STEG23_031214, partial [Scotinomys teguina]